MKRCFYFWGALLLAALVPLTGLYAANATPAELVEARSRLVEGLRTFDSLAMSPKEPWPVGSMYRDVRPSLTTIGLQFRVGAIDAPVLESVTVYHQEKLAVVELGIGIFRLDKKYPGILVGFIAQGMSLARNGITAKVKPYAPDAFQRILDARDALYYHAELVLSLEKNKTRSLYPFEQFLAESLSKDRTQDLTPMANGTMKLLAIDVQLLSSMNDHGLAAKERILDGSDYLRKVTDLSERIYQGLQKAMDTSSQTANIVETRYIAEVSALTMARFGTLMIEGDLANYFPAIEKENPKGFETLRATLSKLTELSTASTSALGYRLVLQRTLGLD